MMTTYISDKVVIPRKRHICAVCDWWIPKGESCHTYVGVEDGIQRSYYHHMCWSYTMRWDHDNWYYFNGGASRRDIAMEIIAGEY